MGDYFSHSIVQLTFNIWAGMHLYHNISSTCGTASDKARECTSLTFLLYALLSQDVAVYMKGPKWFEKA